ncbi:unnamed protein product, partial [Owenia fusiformis]
MTPYIHKYTLKTYILDNMKKKLVLGLITCFVFISCSIVIITNRPGSTKLIHQPLQKSQYVPSKQQAFVRDTEIHKQKGKLESETAETEKADSGFQQIISKLKNEMFRNRAMLNVIGASKDVTSSSITSNRLKGINKPQYYQSVSPNNTILTNRTITLNTIGSSHLKQYAMDNHKKVGAIQESYAIKDNSDDINAHKKTREMEILMWTDYYSRVLPYSGQSPFNKCPISSCSIHFNKSKQAIIKSQAIIFHMWDINFQSSSKRPEIRFPWQQYIFLSTEAPTRDFFRKQNLSALNGFFNMTATYRSDSDLPLPYGYFYWLKKKNNPKDYFKGKTKSILWVVSHCGTESKREKFVRMLKTFVNVDTFGKCGKPMKESFEDYGKNYKFYLALENSDCKDYITEKVWKNAYQNNMIPILRGTKADYKAVLPPDSYIHMDDFKSTKDLAAHIIKVSKNSQLYNSYFKWKERFGVKSITMGLYSTNVFCRLCKLIHERENKTKVYDLKKWLDPGHQCV